MDRGNVFVPLRLMAGDLRCLRGAGPEDGSVNRPIDIMVLTRCRLTLTTDLHNNTSHRALMVLVPEHGAVAGRTHPLSARARRVVSNCIKIS